MLQRADEHASHDAVRPLLLLRPRVVALDWWRARQTPGILPHC
jgi:hypothetical protein